MPQPQKEAPPEEAPLDPDLAIIDPHLHFWHIRPNGAGIATEQRFFVPEVADMIAASGHKVTHSVFVECHAMHRAHGPAELRPVGETEFVQGQAAMSESGLYGPARLANRIVGYANLLLGARVAPVLEAHMVAAPGRFRGIRMNTAFSKAGLFGHPCDPALEGLMARPAFIEGARVLAQMGLSLDVWCLHSQLADVIALADALPALAIVLDHIGTPERCGPWAGRGDEVRAEWTALVTDLAQRPNVAIKLGGMGMDIGRNMGADFRHAASPQLAEEWRPWVETAIAAFTPARAMFESNFPPDNAAASYGATWNAFKIIAQHFAETEKVSLFSGTAAGVYHIEAY